MHTTIFYISLNVNGSVNFREELLSMDESVSMDQQEDQLIANTERLERSSRKLEGAYRIAIETEEVLSYIIIST